MGFYGLTNKHGDIYIPGIYKYVYIQLYTYNHIQSYTHINIHGDCICIHEYTEILMGKMMNHDYKPSNFRAPDFQTNPKIA